MPERALRAVRGVVGRFFARPFAPVPRPPVFHGATEEILTNNGIRSQCSREVRKIWAAKR